jgi:glycosyltransferase involved in cell wall biosynthesis
MPKVAAITITYNRLELTKRTVESFYSKTKVDYHLFIDNGSSDGTQDWIKQYDHIQLDKNYGITAAFIAAVNMLIGYDYILKLDNDVETITDDIISKMLSFYKQAGIYFVASPVDTLIDPNYYPRILKKVNIAGYNVEYVSHTGGAFQLIPIGICRRLCDNYKYFLKGDYMIGNFYRSHGYHPVYLKDLEMKHIGLDQSTPGDKYIM